jgi:hypothetical protein
MIDSKEKKRLVEEIFNEVGKKIVVESEKTQKQLNSALIGKIDDFEKKLDEVVKNTINKEIKKIK